MKNSIDSNRFIQQITKNNAAMWGNKKPHDCGANHCYGKSTVPSPQGSPQLKPGRLKEKSIPSMVK